MIRKMPLNHMGRISAFSLQNFRFTGMLSYKLGTINPFGSFFLFSCNISRIISDCREIARMNTIAEKPFNCLYEE